MSEFILKYVIPAMYAASMVVGMIGLWQQVPYRPLCKAMKLFLLLSLSTMGLFILTVIVRGVG